MDTNNKSLFGNNHIKWVLEELSKSEEVEGVCSENTQSQQN